VPATLLTRGCCKFLLRHERFIIPANFAALLFLADAEFLRRAGFLFWCWRARKIFDA
jgi:hypothetical protein